MVVLGWGRHIFAKSSQAMGITVVTVDACQCNMENDTRGKDEININANNSLDTSCELNFSAKEECCFVTYCLNGVSHLPFIGRC